jgi:Holliday junction resolvase-like predicted endonuclease
MIEQNLLVSLLKLTKDGNVLIKDVNKDCRIAVDIARNLLEKLQNEGLIYLDSELVEVNGSNRIRLAAKAAALGADIEYVSAFLRWQEFEDMAALALERNGYVVSKNVRFKHVKRRWEIDVIGCRKPLVLCVDCKHWQHGLKPSAVRRIVEAQVERARALADTLPSVSLKLNCVKWSKAKFVPMILSLISGSSKFYDDVPVVPVLKLQDFLIQLPAQVELLTYFMKEFIHL